MPDYEIIAHEHKYAVSKNTWKNSHPTSHPTSPRLSRVSSDISLYAPVRHRSLIRTPGVATRAPSFSELASTTRHSRNTSFDPGLEIISVFPRLPEPGQVRAVTPSRFDYWQLGVMEFGSLRITNGGPSPSDDRKRGAKYSSHESTDEANLNLGTGPKEETTTGPKVVEPRPISAAITPITATFLKLESADSGPSSMSSKPGTKELESLSPGISFDSFPLMAAESQSIGLQATSKHTAVEDNLFEEEEPPDTSQDGSAGIGDTMGTQCQADGGRKDAASKAQTIARPDSGFIPSPTSETSNKPFSKTDSGYSSNVSLRTLRDSKGPETDKALPPCPLQPSNPSPTDRSGSAASYINDPRLPPPRPISLESHSTPASPDRDASPPPLPPKDIRRPVAPPVVTKSASIPLLDALILRTKTNKKTGHRPSFLPMTRDKASGPGSPNSIQISPAHSSVSSSPTTHRAALREPGPLRRLLSVASRKGSRRSLGSLSFRNPGSSTSREPTSTPIPFFPKSSKDSRRGTISGLPAMEPAYDDESPPIVTRSPEEGMIRRYRSFHSISATIVNAAASVLPSRRFLRRSESTSIAKTYDDEYEDDTTEVNEESSRNTSYSESDIVSPEDYTLDSLMRNGFDPSFMAMTSARDAYFSPAPSRAPSRSYSRAGSVASPSVDIRLAELYARSSTGSPDSLDVSSPHSASIPEHPYLTSSHSLLRSRSVVQLRVPAPLRPHSTPPRLYRSQSQTLLLEPRHESTHSYPPTTASGRSSLGSTVSSQEAPRRHQRRSTTRSRENEDSVSIHGLEKLIFPPRGPGSHHNRTDSASSQGSSIGAYVRSMSANPYSEQQRHIPGRPPSANPQSRQDPPLRHRASYEGQASKHRLGKTYTRQSPNLWTSTHYEQLQMQYGGTYPPYVPRPGHYRNRSTASQGKSNAPYRVLHSYYTPAYRHVPIWG